MPLASRLLSALAFGVLFVTGGFASSPALPRAQAPSAAAATVLFGGDMMFDRSFRTRVEGGAGDPLFACIDATLAGADAVAANLEGPITDSPSRSLGSAIGAPNNYIFTFPLETATLLYDHRIRIVSYGNNHIMNFGVSGLASTLGALGRAGVAYFGEAAGEAYVYRTLVNGVPLEFINYNQFTSPGPARAASTTAADIVRARAEGFIPIVYAHWGIEYAAAAAQYQRDLAREFVDAGAAAVIGSHPHVVEEHETYRGAPIYYSLGNFMFDQYWDSAVTHGLLLKLTFGARGVTGIQEIPVVLSEKETVCPGAAAAPASGSPESEPG